MTDMTTSSEFSLPRGAPQPAPAAGQAMEAVPADGVLARRWWVLAIVVAAQFMFGVDAFIVNVALPTIATELRASAAEVEAVVAIYLIGYATLVVTGGRLGDIHGTRAVFIAGVLGFTLTSLWCGLATSGPELIVARLAQGATAALMVPQVLATLHVPFPDAARGRAFAIYGGVLGLSGAVGFLFGGLLVSLDVAQLGWRCVFFVNVPFGLAIAAAAARLMPAVPRPAGSRLDLPGAVILFLGLLGIIGPLLFGRDLHWSPPVWGVMALGGGVLAAFVRYERAVARRGGMPLVDLKLFAAPLFARGLGAVFLFFFANLSFYFVLTLFMQGALHFSALQAGGAVVPLALAFVLASRQATARTPRHGARVMIEGCGIALAGLVTLALTLVVAEAPPVWLVALPLVVFGYGQGFVMAPLSSAVLATVAKADAGAGSGLYGTTTQVANAAGVAVIGAVYFALQGAGHERAALFAALACVGASITLCAACLAWMRRAAVAA